MTGHKKEVVSQILEKFSLAFLTDFYDHALNLAIGDIIRAERLLRDTIDTTNKLSKSMKSPLNGTKSYPNGKKNFPWEKLDLKCYALPSDQ